MKITNAAELKTAIALLENQKEIQKQEMKGQFKGIIESMNPLRMVRSAMKKIDAPELINSLISASVGAGAGALSKKIFIGKPTNFVKKVLGRVLQFAVSGVVTKKV